MFHEEEVLPVDATLLEPLDEKFSQGPIGLKIPVALPSPQRGIVIVNNPDHTPLVLGLCLLGFFALLAFLATGTKRKD